MKKFLVVGLIAPVAMVAMTGAAFASGHHHDPADPATTSTIIISNSGTAIVSNIVSTDSNTGFNTANGGSVTGNGTSTGSSIVTGNALAASLVLNDLNPTQITVPAGSASSTNSLIMITTMSNANMGNVVGTSANTGFNTANGGTVVGCTSSCHHHNSSSSGMSFGGIITTGNLASITDVENYLNTTITAVN
ncbi:MAG: hypothetical protein KGJ13_06805 [Patescibacteria group bacterium]|nr:hypothetical protein [Patescibacteria group bacterium]